MNSKHLRVAEIFGPTIQGEGTLIGQPTVFVRLGGCDYRCSWCDSLHAVDSQYRDQWSPMSARDIMGEVEELSGFKPIMVTLSGGNPAIQDCSDLIALGHDMGYRFAMETQGSIAQDWFSDLDMLVLSPKPPSSEMKCDLDVLQACINAGQGTDDIVLKYVVQDERDYQFARDVSAPYPSLKVFLQPCNTSPPDPAHEQNPIEIDQMRKQFEWLVDYTLRDGWYDAIVLPQLHVWLWGNKQGV